MKKLSLFLVAVCISTANFGFAEDGSAATPSGGSNEPVAVQPKMTISNEQPAPSLLAKEKGVFEASFRYDEPEVPFPSRARMNKVLDGRAAVGVMLDADGKAIDFLIVRYTQPYFAEEVLNTIRKEEYSPKIVKGVTVPGRFYVKREFNVTEERDPRDANQPATVSMNAMEQLGSMSDRISDGGKGSKLLYKAWDESEVDGHLLKMTVVETPLIPAGSELQPNQVLKVVVSFYVDEQGRVRLPDVDSNAPAPIVRSVIKAVSDWKFAPPTIKKKPVLVFTNRTLALELKTPSTTTAEAKPTGAAGT